MNPNIKPVRVSVIIPAWNEEECLTPPWFDVDSPADVQRLLAELSHQPVAVLSHTRQFFNHYLTESRQA